MTDAPHEDVRGPITSSAPRYWIAARALALVAAAAVALSACGGPMQPDELKRGIESLGSTAATGQLLAEQARRGRLRDVFTRVQARRLGETANHEAEKLNDAAAKGSIAEAKSKATKIAQDISDALGQLQVAPDDPVVARETATKLRDASKHAGDLGGRL